MWLGNSRGNKYSTVHDTLSWDEDAYWQFDWQEMGTGDQKTNISYILEHTGYENLPYLGHSQGTSQMFYALSVDTWFNDKISVFVAMGPVTKLTNATSPFMVFGCNHMELYEKLVWAYDIQTSGGDGASYTIDDTPLCLENPEFCVKLELISDTTDPNADDPTRYAVSYNHDGGSTPVRSSLHYCQNKIEDRFQVWAPKYGSLIGR